ncbi:MAG TPA: hypothetical protein VJS69_00885 [Candidatus Krumholzibacteria bacterium]|nr:hypothetical protein [Candidatus Krumholzibacteria bacterium]
MRRIACARLIVAAPLAVLSLLPMKAGAAGVYENASAEPAFLLSPRRPTLSADLDFSSNDPIEAAIYRVGATFPLRKFFAVGLEQTFVSVSDTNQVKSGIGDLTIRSSARAWGGKQRALMLLGTIATGVTNQEFFPYSSKTLDLTVSAAYVDTLGDVSAYAIGGRTWVNRSETERPVDIQHSDNWRGSAGVGIGGGDVRALGGTIYEYTSDHTERWMWYGAVSVIFTDAMVLRGGIQFETGAETQRVSDWAANAGFTIRFQ